VPAERRPRRSAGRERPPRKHSYGADEPDGSVMDTMTHIRQEFIDEFADNTNRHELGIGLLGRCLGLKRKDKIDEDIQRQLDAIGAKTYRQVAACLYRCLFISACLILRYSDLFQVWG